MENKCLKKKKKSPHLRKLIFEKLPSYLFRQASVVVITNIFTSQPQCCGGPVDSHRLVKDSVSSFTKMNSVFSYDSVGSMTEYPTRKF